MAISFRVHGFVNGTCQPDLLLYFYDATAVRECRGLHAWVVLDGYVIEVGRVSAHASDRRGKSKARVHRTCGKRSGVCTEHTSTSLKAVIQTSQGNKVIISVCKRARMLTLAPA